MKIALLNCYFGHLPVYFRLWLQSCEKNPTVDFFLFTDDTVPDRVPPNVSVVQSSFEEMINRIQSKFDFRVAITSPYKLTDFKPAYGFIFEDLFKPYDYWGYCDMDLVFGNIMKYIQQPMEQGIEKIYRLGHLTVYKNSEKMRQLFRQKGAKFSYKEVFSNPEFYSFDEHAGMISIAKRQGISQYCREDMADISCRIKRMTASRHENYPYQVFYSEDGAVYRSYLKNGAVESEEYIYIHFQKRGFSSIEKSERFFLLSDRIQEKQPGIPGIEEIKALSEYVDDGIDRSQLLSFKRRKMKVFFSCSLKEKSIWIKNKLAEINLKNCKK